MCKSIKEKRKKKIYIVSNKIETSKETTNAGRYGFEADAKKECYA